MTKIDRCLKLIRDIRNVSDLVDPPYVARSRIGRLSVSAAKLVADSFGNSGPDLPGPIGVRRGASVELVALAESCNRLSELARHVSQPSEPLDDRWRKGWNELLSEIAILEDCLDCLRSERRQFQMKTRT